MAKITIEYSEQYKTEIPVTYAAARAVETLIKGNSLQGNRGRTKEDIDLIDINRIKTKGVPFMELINGLRTKESGDGQPENRERTKETVTAAYGGYIGKAYGCSSFSVYDGDNKEIFHSGYMMHRPENEEEVVTAIKEALELIEKLKKNAPKAAGDRQQATGQEENNGKD